jgi:ferredoxin-thioredoxin reductase catalytic subunit
MNSNLENMRQYVRNIAKSQGYHPCPDKSMLEDLTRGLVKNEERYGYRSCPCREASGMKKHDLDIICPCRYCDDDVKEYGMCYCGLYVSEEVKKDPTKLGPIPERRPQELIDRALLGEVSNVE